MYKSLVFSLLFFLPPSIAKACPTAPSAHLMQKFCASSTGGDLAQIRLFKNNNGDIGFYEFRGDPSKTSHPPIIYYNQKGEPVLTSPHEPMEPDGKKFEKIRQKKDLLLKGYFPAEKFLCPEVKNLPEVQC